jgi:hypothetical protein
LWWFIIPLKLASGVLIFGLAKIDSALPPIFCLNDTMKKTICTIKFTACLLWALMVLAVGTTQTFGQIIPPSTIVTNNWQTCGTRSQTEYPNDINVTQSPYNADNTGVTDATAAIQAAINAETPDHAVFFPAGNYLIKGGLSITANNIILRGVNTNTTLIGVGSGGGMLTIGHSGDNNGAVTDFISSGSTNGSTSFTLTSSPSFVVGDLIALSQDDGTLGTTNFPIFSDHQFTHNVQQEEIVTGISGNTVLLSDPIVWDFTNSPVVLAAVGPIVHGVGVENIIFNNVNSATGGKGSYSFTIWMIDCYDCWVTNCSALNSFSYCWFISNSSHITMFGDTLRFGQGIGADHSGLLTQNIGGCLIANNIMADGLQPGIEFDQGTVGDVFFGNFFTNNLLDVDEHAPHVAMNLWEENVISKFFEMDGYYGSGSHQTLLRNGIGVSGTSDPIVFNRWTSFMNVVGNILGSSVGSYGTYASTVNNPSVGMIIVAGYPNIGNGTYAPTTSPVSWNYPLSGFPSADNTSLIYPSPIYTFTNNQGPTNVLLGNFTNIASIMTTTGDPALAGSVYTLVIQDNNNTNLYYPTNGSQIEAISAGTPTNLAINQNITVFSGESLYVSGQNAYQQMQSNTITLNNINGNYDYFHNSVFWNSNGVQTIPISLAYPNGPPFWWNSSGTLPWPSIGSDLSPMVGLIPAEMRYEGITIPNTPTGLQALPWMN